MTNWLLLKFYQQAHLKRRLIMLQICCAKVTGVCTSRLAYNTFILWMARLWIGRHVSHLISRSTHMAMQANNIAGNIAVARAGMIPIIFKVYLAMLGIRRLVEWVLDYVAAADHSASHRRPYIDRSIQGSQQIVNRSSCGRGWIPLMSVCMAQDMRGNCKHY